MWHEFRVEENKWLQKSRVHWLKEGDRNTYFFHLVSKIRRRRNNISKLKFEGREVDDPRLIKEGIFNHFKIFL